ncbi:MAG: YbaB/EbfC family nucleoid-associated protein [Candidatus Pacebacteria bacterium]|nr:YbaB/EbfC family nucleoid-associated protein [Candidatus Paceibacterota bacterium]
MVNMGKMLKQAQKMQSQMAEIQKEIAAMEKSFSAGGGVVEAVARGDNTLTSITIKPEAVDPDDVEGLEDLILTAVNGALDEVKQAAEEKMSDITGGMSLPGLM